MKKRTLFLTLELEDSDNLTLDEVYKDLNSKINDSDLFYVLKDLKEKTSTEYVKFGVPDKALFDCMSAMASKNKEIVRTHYDIDICTLETKFVMEFGE